MGFANRICEGTEQILPAFYFHLSLLSPLAAIHRKNVRAGSGEGMSIVFKKPFRGGFNGDEIHCLLRLRREGIPERLSRS